TAPVPKADREAARLAPREVAITTFGSETEALMVAEMLENEGIHSVLVPLGAGAGGLGQTVWRPFEMRVSAGDADRAREFLAGLEAGEDESGNDEAGDPN
ncbi:MAG: hypothetical protein Q7R39_01830, partial [Dehalococcoidia bacterium]|nr:hypothetical protein [Dehalococcoidia bacterium]